MSNTARSQHALEDLTDVVQGSAVAVSEDEGLTNCHVIADRPTIVIIQNKEMASSTVVRADPGSDRCFIRSDRLKLHPVLGVRPYSELVVGQRVLGSRKELIVLVPRAIWPLRVEPMLAT